MQFFVISLSALVFVLTLILFYKWARMSDHKSRRIKAIKGKGKVQIDEELEKPFVQRVILPFFTALTKLISNLLPKRKSSKRNENSSKYQKTEKNLKLAGLTWNINDYNARRIILLGGLFFISLIGVLFASAKPEYAFLIIATTLIIGYMLPILYIRMRINRRQEEITNQLPDVMDLLAVSVEAGLGFDAALAKINEKMNGLLIDEFNVVLNEIKYGKPRRSALKDLAERTPVEELKTFVSAMIQAEHLGIPIKNVLNTQAQQIRTARRQKAEEKAAKAPIKMMLPLVLFVLPVLIIIILGPTVLILMEKFG
ncbi:type II secretion system F family protein [Dehalobacter sp. DCM]|uniref:type II secretion system F family protein n=1 Tax=Dehalobacter sp. DCM TaxID=2907827 RepID=UPI0030819025|nr:type II secretion system F family protein [Dehalobacter sp. DCM]